MCFSPSLHQQGCFRSSIFPQGKAQGRARLQCKAEEDKVEQLKATYNIINEERGAAHEAHKGSPQKTDVWRETLDTWKTLVAETEAAKASYDAATKHLADVLGEKTNALLEEQWTPPNPFAGENFHEGVVTEARLGHQHQLPIVSKHGSPKLRATLGKLESDLSKQESIVHSLNLGTMGIDNRRLRIDVPKEERKRDGLRKLRDRVKQRVSSLEHKVDASEVKTRSLDNDKKQTWKVMSELMHRFALSDDGAAELTGPFGKMNCRYHQQVDCRMDTATLAKWFVALARAVNSKEQPVILILNNVPFHHKAWNIARLWEETKGLTVLFLIAISTSSTQPLGLSIVGATKKSAKTLLDEFYMATQSISGQWAKVTALHKINYMIQSWEKLLLSFIANCFGSSPVFADHKYVLPSKSVQKRIDARLARLGLRDTGCSDDTEEEPEPDVNIIDDEQEDSDSEAMGPVNPYPPGNSLQALYQPPSAPSGCEGPGNPSLPRFLPTRYGPNGNRLSDAPSVPPMCTSECCKPSLSRFPSPSSSNGYPSPQNGSPLPHSPSSGYPQPPLHGCPSPHSSYSAQPPLMLISSPLFQWILPAFSEWKAVGSPVFHWISPASSEWIPFSFWERVPPALLPTAPARPSE